MADGAAQEELEALRYTFTEDELRVVRQEPLELAVRIAPYTGEDQRQQFVEACLVLRTDDRYPAQPAAVELENAKGLGDARQAAALATLRREAAGMAGEMMLSALCESARNLLTEANSPEGACAFCLDPLASSGAAAPAGLQRLPCYHCFHFSCFAAWYASAQVERRAQRAQLQADLGHGATEELMRARGLAPHKQGLFSVLCPTCRLPVPPTEFSRQELRALAEEARRVRGQQQSRAVCLPDAERLQLTALQQRNQAIYARQLQSGGIVPDQYAVAL